MGVTYKAFDVDLQCPVALKVINERYLNNELVRLRFLREARAAASIRHPNVASVFHLGRTGEHYFYAMEFVQGETLERLVKHCGRLDVKPALEIATQVAAGLAAVHKQKLVHRDIKPAWQSRILKLRLRSFVRNVDVSRTPSFRTPGANSLLSRHSPT
jgi:serine/threonine protein kinase